MIECIRKQDFASAFTVFNRFDELGGPLPYAALRLGQSGRYFRDAKLRLELSAALVPALCG
jgi:hypothetical protein